MHRNACQLKFLRLIAVYDNALEKINQFKLTLFRLKRAIISSAKASCTKDKKAVEMKPFKQRSLY